MSPACSLRVLSGCLMGGLISPAPDDAMASPTLAMAAQTLATCREQYGMFADLIRPNAWDACGGQA
jgi:hypothetical protein